ncbi:CinA domain protein [Arcobacter nitrofigilis DSM 7299]|uniref:CinA domain protein n=1 Tax=Arcobacter nitrofigilis (strain ATCC 33309 / DSM 7299 / CCUG 15893 / LMG 7604 / NCTC 12251 / CI) TaxID=572480 RepID=D5V2J7_ARCNC|nr:CinA family protein [Arcobacter nitrofigilis]ADG92429.1 CinA domain protein [Arcobacter nitrofigilis DSM 7299]
MFNDIFNKQDMIDMQNLLLKHSKSITCAESCTGGLVASLITKISGSSNIFNGSIVSYSNKIKNQELNVSSETLEKFGAVSKETVKEMLSGVIKKFDANYAIAISGVAGPNGGTKTKPVGHVIIGIMDDSGYQEIDIFQFFGNREEVQIQAAKSSLFKISKLLQKTLDK